VVGSIRKENSMRYLRMYLLLKKVGANKGDSIYQFKHLLKIKGFKKNLSDKDITVLYKLARRFYKIF
jgi:hypothetical protein